MNASICVSCLKPKAALICGLCESTICKYCAHIIEDDTFSYLPVVPQHLLHTTYCHQCFDNTVAADLESYNQMMEQAKDVAIFGKNQGKETRLIERLQDPTRVTDCADEKEVIMRLAFLAVKAGCNTVVDVDTKYEKVKNGSYTTMKWQGSGVAAHFSENKVVRDRSIWHQPN